MVEVRVNHCRRIETLEYDYQARHVGTGLVRRSPVPASGL